MHLEELRCHRDQIIALAAKYKAENVRVFGSVLRGEETESSDVDILVHFVPGASLFDESGLECALRDLLGVKVDLVADDAIREVYAPYILGEAQPL